MAKTDKWEIYQDKKGEYRWRCKSQNGNIVGAATEGYVKKVDCVANAQRHGMDGNPKKLGGNDKWELYQDKKGGHRWRRTARNGQKVGASSEAYTKLSDCKANAKRNGYTG